MELQQLVGNEGLKNGLLAAVRGGTLSHSYLISGPEGSGKRTLARYLCAAMECTGEMPPCCVCSQCRKVLDGAHPDVVVVDDPEKKTVTVGMAREAKTDLYIRPNEGKRKIYLFPRAQEMNAQAQNALLKVLEEPPVYGVFLLLSDRPERLLPTIRSRCAELRLSPVSEAEATAWLREKHPEATDEQLLSAYRRSGGFLGQALRELEGEQERDPLADALLRAYAEGDRLGVTEVLWKLEKYKRDPFTAVLRTMLRTLGEALTVRSGGQGASETASLLAERRTAADLASAYRDLREMLTAADGNVGVGHVCGCMAARLR